jgi:hypothetical protein
MPPTPPRDYRPADFDAVWALNQANDPAVNALPRDRFAWIVARAWYHRVTEDARGITGFLLVLPPGVRDYWSENYGWFSARYDAFAYVDRIAVEARARGAGVGSALYDDLAATASGTWPCILCEVNLDPPNPVSLAFHQRHGFTEVGRQQTEGGTKTVVMLRRPL